MVRRIKRVYKTRLLNLIFAFDIGHSNDIDDNNAFNDDCSKDKCFSFRKMNYAGESNEELVSALIASMCQLLSPSSSPFYVDHMHNLLTSKSHKPTEYSIRCDSLAEFYILPLITGIGDEDHLIAQIEELAFAGDFPVLPIDMSGFSGTIRCF